MSNEKRSYLDSTNHANGDIIGIGILLNVNQNKYFNHNKLVSNYHHRYYNDNLYCHRNHPNIDCIHNCTHFGNNHSHRKLVGQPRHPDLWWDIDHFATHEHYWLG